MLFRDLAIGRGLVSVRVREGGTRVDVDVDVRDIQRLTDLDIGYIGGGGGGLSRIARGQGEDKGEREEDDRAG